MPKQTTQDRLATQSALGLNTDPVEVEVEAPLTGNVPSDADIEAPRTAAEDGPGFFDALGASFRVDNSLPAVVRNVSDPEFSYDPAFDSVTYADSEDVKARLDALTLADQDEVGAIMGGAFNRDHADFLLERLEKTQADEQLIIEAGAKGFLARLGANVLDPVDLAVTAAAAPLGVAVKAKKLGRIGRAAVTAATAGAANAAVEGVVGQDNAFRDETDVLFAALAGITLGGALGSLSRGENARIERTADSVARDHLDSVGAARRIIEGDGENAPLRPSAEQRLDDILGDEDAPEFTLTGADRILHNLRGTLFTGTEATRAVASRMLEGGFLKDKSKTRGLTAEGRAKSIYQRTLARVANTTDAAFRSWAKENGFGSLRRLFGTKAHEQFMTEVTAALRGLDGASPQAIKAATRFREALDVIGETAQAAGIKGFDKELLQNYVPRVYNIGKLRRAFDRYGEDNFRAWFRESILSAEDVSDEVAEKIAKGVVRTLRETTSGVDTGLTRGISLDDADQMRQLLGEDAEEFIEALTAARARREAKGGTVKFAKSRVRLDEGYSAPIRKLDGAEEVLNFTDLVENDAWKLLDRYTKVMSGHIGLAKELGITSRADFENAKVAIASKADGKSVKGELEALDDAYKLITGSTIEKSPGSKGSQLSRAFRDFNFARLSGKFGVAQIAEIGNVVAIGGWRSFARLPGLTTIARRNAEGELIDDIARQNEVWFAPGTDFEIRPAKAGFDEFGEGFDSSTALGRGLQAVDAPLQATNRLASVASLMAPINARLEKAAAREYVLLLSDFASGTRKLTESKMARWRGAGLDDETMQRVLGEIRKHGTYDGKRLKSLNVDKWDPAIAETAGEAIRRQSAFAIQRNDFGDIPTVAFSPIGRTVLQFKTFMIGSINKQLNRGVHYWDIETATAWSAGMFFAGLAYTAQVHIDHANDPEKRKELLTPEKIAGTAFQRAGFAAILVPAAATISNQLGNDELFNQRTSGLSSVISFDSNPTTSLLKDVGSTALLPANLLNDDYRFSQADLRRIERLLPFHRVLAVKNFLHTLEEDLPERSKP